MVLVFSFGFFLFSHLVMELSVLTLNCNGIRDASKRAGLLQWVRSLPVRPDIICLQEVHCSSVRECSSWFQSSGFGVVCSPGSVRSAGCVILFRDSLSVSDSWRDAEKRYLQCEFSFRGKSFRMCSLYVPNRNPARDSFLRDLQVKIDFSVPSMLCGDFNTVFDRALDRRGSDPSDTSRESSSALRGLFDACSVVDIFRYLHPSTPGYTWSKWNGTLASRIDLVGIPSQWVSSVSACSVVPCPFSDHCGAQVSVTVPDSIPSGPGLWKLNTAVLKEAEYVRLISDFWLAWHGSVDNFSTLAKWWDAGKSRLKGLTIRYCKSRSAGGARNRSLLADLVAHLKTKVDAGSVSCVGPYRSALESLASLDREAARGAQVRSRIRWVEEDESSTSYFLRLEKKRAVDRWIPALRESGGSIVSSPDGLCRTLNTFYSDLFSSVPTDSVVQASLLSNFPCPLPCDQARVCEGLLTHDECLRALKNMAKNKAPGLDGFPAEFYLRFWHVLGGDLVAVLNSCFRSGSLALSQRRGVITLSFKRGDRLDPRNWRPITLLNVDYKIASRVIAGRLLKVIHLVVSGDQTCGVPGRFIGENVSLLRDVVHYASSSGTPVAILSLDQEKAFDRVDWGFMKSTLVAMGFGPSFISWVNLFYFHVQSSVNVNGYLSPFFPLSRGVRQGCPLSPLLYVLVSEVLAVNIRRNPRISGLSLPGFPPLSPISQYADDTSLVLTSDESIRAVFETFAQFEAASGAKLNRSKSKGLWLGAWSGRSNPPVALDWSSDKLKILALVINALALSRVWYVASLVHMPAWVEKELSRLVFSFFWSGKRELVSRATVVQPHLFGGFSVENVEFKVFSLLGQWVKRFASSPSGWSSFMSFWFLSSFGVPLATVLSRPFSFDPGALPPFYSSLLFAWRRLNGSFSSSLNSLAVGVGSPLVCTPVAGVSTKSCYLYLLSENMVQPHCVDKFSFTFGPLDWPATWRSLSFFDVDRHVIDLNWKVAHGVLYTFPLLVSVSDHRISRSPLLLLLLFSFSFMCPALLVRHVRFGFSSDELCVTPRVFVYLLNLCKFYIWQSRNDFRFRNIPPGAVDVIAKVKARLKCHLPIFFKRFQSARRRRYFHRQWGARGVVASVSGNVLSIVL